MSKEREYPHTCAGVSMRKGTHAPAAQVPDSARALRAVTIIVMLMACCVYVYGVRASSMGSVYGVRASLDISIDEIVGAGHHVRLWLDLCGLNTQGLTIT